MKKTINIAMFGLGTVGSGVYKVLGRQKNNIDIIGANLNLRKIVVKDPGKKRNLKVKKGLLTSSALEVINDPSIDVVVELIGGIEPAFSVIKKCLERGKHVVTANKLLLASYGKELFATAKKNNVDIYFEAAVAGGIPIIRPLKDSLAGNNIEKVMGIVNGTTNYILSKMTAEGASFKEVLAEAQSLGYAEANPEADVEGHDAAAKLAILASIAFNSRVTFKDVYKEGITKIEQTDILYANDIGKVIKLIALAKQSDGGIEVRVHPTMIPATHPLAAVNGVFNAVFVEGDSVGELMFYGQGAGSLPTASAVVGDIIDIGRNIVSGRSLKMECSCYDKKKILPIDSILTSYYLRMKVHDKPGVLAKIAKAFGDKQVSIQSVIQKGPASRGGTAELMFISHPVVEKNLNRALKVIDKLDVVSKINNVIRVEQ
jgi:homoserine dehydrogenase